MQNFIDINVATIGKYFKIDGVATRLEFWYFVLFNWLVGIGASMIDIFIPGNFLENLVSVFFLIPSITVAIRRMHDTDHNGFWLLIPFINLYLLIVPTRPSRWNPQSQFES